MRIYELKPTSEDSADWKVSEYKGTVIIRAQDEKSARNKVALEFLAFTEAESCSDTPILPWINDKLVICKQLDNSEYDEEGAEEILFPKDYPKD